MAEQLLKSMFEKGYILRGGFTFMTPTEGYPYLELCHQGATEPYISVIGSPGLSLLLEKLGEGGRYVSKDIQKWSGEMIFEVRSFEEYKKRF